MSVPSLPRALILCVAAVAGWAPATQLNPRSRTRPTRLAAKPPEPAAASPLAAPEDDRAVWVEPKDWVPGDFESDEAVPLYVLDGPLIPGSSHDVSVPANDAGLSKLFDDLLRTGSRRVITTWGVRAENRTCLARYGCQMELQKVEDVREESQGRLQWRCRHQLSSSRVRIDKVVARSAGDASYLRCVASESADVESDPSEVIAGSQVRVRTGKHAGVSGTVEGVVNGWVRLRTDDGEVLASRGRRSVEVVDAPETSKEVQKSPLASLLKTLEQTTGELGELVKRLDVRTKKTLQDSIGIEKVTFEETVTELPLPRREKQLLELLKEVAALQREVDEDVRFNEKAVSLLGAGRGVGVGTLWNVAETWLAYLDGRASGVRRKLHADLHERLLDFLRSTGRLPEVGMDVGDASATLALSELPRDLRAALTTLDARVADDLEPVHAAKHELQALLDAETHDARCDAFSAIVRREKSRLLARKGLRKLFGGPEVVGDTVPLPEGWSDGFASEDDELDGRIEFL